MFCYISEFPKVSLSFWKMYSFIYFLFRRVEAESRSGYMDAGQATRYYCFITVNVCKASHALQLHWSTQMHTHLRIHQSGNAKSSCFHCMRCVLIALEGGMITFQSVNFVRCANKGLPVHSGFIWHWGCSGICLNSSGTFFLDFDQ